MAKDNVDVGIAGLGNISDIHAQAILNSGHGRLAAAFSSSKEKLDKFCDLYQAEGYTSYQDFLKHPGLDVVSICTPSGTHLDFGKQAAEAGKHVMIEKPIEITLERAGDLIKSCRKNRIRLAVIYQSRFTDDAIRMKSDIRSGKLGDIFLVTATLKWFRNQDYYALNPWRGTLKLDGGGAVINQSIHTIDLLQWMLGDVHTLQSYKGTFTHEGIEGEDNAVAAYQFKSGVIGTFAASTSVVPAQPRQIEVHGTKGTALLKDSAYQLIRDGAEPENHPEKKAAGGASPMANFQFDAHKNQFNEIFKAILNGEDPPVTGKESLQSLAFVHAIYESSRTGERVSVNDLIERHSLSQ